MKHEVERAGRTAVLLDPHPLCRAVITTMLKTLDTTVVASASTAASASTLLEEHRPDLLVAELDLPEGREHALEVIKTGVQANPTMTVVVLSASGDDDLVDAAFDAGVSAFVLKTAEPDDVKAAISQAFAPSIYLSRRRGLNVTPTTQVEREAPQLTRRELEILRLVSEGRSNRQVGKLLWITDQTVKFHLANVYRKLGVCSRYEAARWARENGLLDVTQPLSTHTAASTGIVDLLPEQLRVKLASRERVASENGARETSR